MFEDAKALVEKGKMKEALKTLSKVRDDRSLWCLSPKEVSRPKIR